MPEVNLLLVLVAAVLCFVLGGAYYAVMGARLARVSDAAAAGGAAAAAMVVEALRCLVLAAVVVGLAAWAGVETVIGGLALGLLLWTGFPLVLWVGAIVHENTRWRLAAIHAGDWLVKLLAISVLAGVWP